jgi:hypothetical protein
MGTLTVYEASVSGVAKDSLMDAAREYAKDISLVYTEYQP